MAMRAQLTQDAFHKHKSIVSRENGTPANEDRNESLSQLYHRLFEVIACDTPELVREAQRLRYQVYCLETGFEDPKANPDGLERDEADARSLHRLLVHRQSGMVAGTVRLVLPDPTLPHCGLPAYEVAPELRKMAGSQLPLSTTAEISRFAVSKAFRRRLQDSPPSVAFRPEGVRTPDHRVIPTMTLGLMRAIAEMGWITGMSHVVATVEPALLRLLGRTGVSFEKAGSLVDYHGRRQPVFRDYPSWSGSIFERDRDVWSLVTAHGTNWPAPTDACPEKHPAAR